MAVPRSEQEILNEIYGSHITYTNLGSAATEAVKALGGKVMSLTVFNDNSTRRFAQIHNTSAAPQDDDVPSLSFLIPGDSQVVIGTDYFGQGGIDFADGISFVFSSTPNTATSAAAADCTAFINYL